MCGAPRYHVVGERMDGVSADSVPALLVVMVPLLPFTPFFPKV